jgi:dephospho-CoA kinase
MDNLKILLLVGMPGAGKSYCVEYLKKKGIPSVYFGGITIDEVKSRGLEVNEQNEKLVREELREKEGKGAYAQRMITKIKNLHTDGYDRIVADGLYSWTEYKIFKEAFGDNAVVVAVAAPRKVRHERLAVRPVRPLNESEVTNREYAEIENLEKGGPIANADFTLVNDTDTDNLLKDLEAVLVQNSF